MHARKHNSLYCVKLSNLASPVCDRRGEVENRSVLLTWWFIVMCGSAAASHSASGVAFGTDPCATGKSLPRSNSDTSGIGNYNDSYQWPIVCQAQF